jgi:hypothetical protein
VKLQKRIRLINGDQGDTKGDEREIKGIIREKEIYKRDTGKWGIKQS